MADELDATEVPSVVVDLSMSGVSRLDNFVSGFGNRFLTREISLRLFEIALVLMEVVRRDKDAIDWLLKFLGGSEGRSGALMSRNNG